MTDAAHPRIARARTIAVLWLLGCAEAPDRQVQPADTGDEQETVDCTYEWGCWALDNEVVASGSPNSTMKLRDDPASGTVAVELVLRTADLCSGGGGLGPIDKDRMCGVNLGDFNTHIAEHQGSVLPDLSNLPTVWEIDLLLLECLGYQGTTDNFRYRRLPTTAVVEITAVDDHMVHFDLRSEANIDREAGPGDSTLTITTDVQICDYAGVTPFRAP